MSHYQLKRKMSHLGKVRPRHNGRDVWLREQNPWPEVNRAGDDKQLSPYKEEWNWGDKIYNIILGAYIKEEYRQMRKKWKCRG